MIEYFQFQILNKNFTYLKSNFHLTFHEYQLFQLILENRAKFPL